MKKISIIVLDKERNTALEHIRELGVLHVEQKTVSSPSITHLLGQKAKVDAAMITLQNFAPKKRQKAAASPTSEDGQDDLDSLTDRILFLADELKTLQDWTYTNTRELNLYETWGEFDPAELDALTKAGIVLTPYVMSHEAYSEIAKTSDVVVLKADKEAVHFVLVGAPLHGYTPLTLPKHPADKLRKLNGIKRSQIDQVEKALGALNARKADLLHEEKEVMQKIEFEINSAGMEKINFNRESDSGGTPGESTGNSPFDFSVSYITGYVPAGEMERINRAASENGWAFIACDPAKDDEDVPTLLKNNKLASLIYPLTNFLDMVPGYREVDISGWFMLFFTIYFGMLFGDAAYGLLLFLAAVIGIIKTFKKGVPPGLKLLLLLSLSNIAWGVLTCSWFAISPEMKGFPQFLKNMSLGLISTAKGANEVDVKNHLILFCFSLALLQLSIAHIKGIVRYSKSLRVLGEVGQILMLAGMWDVVCWLVIGKDYEVFQKINAGWGIAQAIYLLLAGFILKFVFASYEGNIGQSILASVKNIISVILGITNVFADIMSYIRLWAVGFAGASIAITVNTMATGMLGNTAGPVVAQLLLFAGVALLCFGHSFNLVLNVLAVLVHGVRLNTLEFSGHVGITWSGFAYRPFTKR
jgi:V/A-type H+-transporting ATPase subunit I